LRQDNRGHSKSAFRCLLSLEKNANLELILVIERSFGILRPSRMRKINAYLPALLWMLAIFVASTDLGSNQRTSRLIGPFLRWFKPDVSEATIRAVQAVVRKSGHVTGYAILALLLFRARRLDTRLPGGPWQWREFWIVVAVCAAYAVSDEVHQSFVPSRQGSVIDILIDTSGAAAGLLLLRWAGRWRKIW
jgi:VanZ family protein